KSRAGEQMSAWIGPAITAGGGIISSLLGGSSGTSPGDQADWHKWAATNGLRLTIRGAQEAGIHPLYAMGYQPHTLPWMSAGDNRVGNAVAHAAGGLADIYDRTQTAKEQQAMQEYNRLMMDQNLRKGELEIQQMANAVAKQQRELYPPLPTPTDRYLLEGQANSGLVHDQAMSRNRSAPERPSQEPAAVADMGFTRTETGFAPVFSQDAKERLEDDLPGVLAWSLRNRLLPSFQLNRNPPPIPLRAGLKWRYNPFLQEYVPMRQNKFGIWVRVPLDEALK
ncbi:MAG: hypothetical protein QXT77_08580, partial [Candidatus Methanomethylicaceae archaeon]